LDGLTILLLFIITSSIIGIIFAIYYNNFQRCLVKINEVDSKIDISLRERFDLLCKAADFIKAQIDEEVMLDLEKLKDLNLSSFDFERKLIPITIEFYNLKASNKKLVKLIDFTNIDFSLRENEAQLNAFVSYYNDNIARFNKMVRVFPSNVVAKIFRFREKNYYDGKDLNDEDINDFKL